jgi:Mobilization protein NikA
MKREINYERGSRNLNPEKRKILIEQKNKPKEKVLLLDMNSIQDQDTIELEIVPNDSQKEIALSRNSRCVSVDTNLPAPLGRRKKKSFKAKSEIIKFRCSLYEKKLLKVKATACGLTLSEYVRRIAFNQITTERFSEEHIEIYKMLIKYHNNFKSIGNMFKKRNPKLTEAVHELANEIKSHLKKFQQ